MNIDTLAKRIGLFGRIRLSVEVAHAASAGIDIIILIEPIILPESLNLIDYFLLSDEDAVLDKGNLLFCNLFL